jgi:phosphoenolpyruvate synthase/pyruvate phosphate dikinase
MDINKKDLEELHAWACLKYRDLPAEEVKSAINMKIALAESIPEGADKTLYLRMLARNATLNAIVSSKRLKRDSRLDREFVDNFPRTDNIEFPQLDTSYYIKEIALEERTVLDCVFVREDTVDETLTVARCGKSAYYRRYHKGINSLKITFESRPYTVRDLQFMPADKFARTISSPGFRVFKTKG